MIVNEYSNSKVMLSFVHSYRSVVSIVAVDVPKIIIKYIWNIVMVKYNLNCIFFKIFFHAK